MLSVFTLKTCIRSYLAGKMSKVSHIFTVKEAQLPHLLMLTNAYLTMYNRTKGGNLNIHIWAWFNYFVS